MKTMYVGMSQTCSENHGINSKAFSELVHSTYKTFKHSKPEALLWPLLIKVLCNRTIVGCIADLENTENP